MKRAIGVAVAGVVLTLVALTFDAAPLFVPGVAFVVIGLGAPAWVWLAARPATVTRKLQVERVVEMEPLEAMIEVRRGWLGLPGAELRDPLASNPVVLKMPMSLIRGGRVADVRIVTRFTRRGLRRLEPPSLVVQDPLELAHLAKTAGGPAQELLVLPHTERVRWGAGGRGRPPQRSEGRSLAEPMAAIDVDGLRPYRPGTPASRIHWPALARGAGLLERRLQADRDTRPLVVLDARGRPREDQLDAAVRAAASLTLELARLGGCRLLLPGERSPIWGPGRRLTPGSRWSREGPRRGHRCSTARRASGPSSTSPCRQWTGFRPLSRHPVWARSWSCSPKIWRRFRPAGRASRWPVARASP